MDVAIEERIRTGVEKGLSKKEIKTLLLSAGWPENTVNSYIEKTYKNLDSGVVLTAHSITKLFGTKLVLQNVDLDIRAGEIFGLIGSSGAGKTTLLNVLVGFLRPELGDVYLAKSGGASISLQNNPEEIKKHIGFSTQTPSFYPKLTVLENLEHFGTLLGLEENDLRRRTNALLDLVGLTDAKHVQGGQLSGGMQKRLDIACALLSDPEILILDEPTADLDPIMRKHLWGLIKQINAKGTTIILASHFLAEIELLCDRIAILHNKKIAELGTAEELRNAYSKNFDITLTLQSENYEPLNKELKKRKTKTEIQPSGDLKISTTEPDKIIDIINSSIKKGDLLSLHVTKPSLGEVFEHLVTK